MPIHSTLKVAHTASARRFAFRLDSFGRSALASLMISEVAIDDAGRMLPKPANTLFDDLHTAGAWGFRWEEPTQSLAIPRPKEWTYHDWFEHVVKIIASQYGVHLKVGEQTRLMAVPLSVREEIEAAA